jgi:uncharacterized membrane protein
MFGRVGGVFPVGILGYIHVAFGILALVLGLVIFCLVKGTRLHRILGYSYIASMLGLNVTGLVIYRLFGFFGPFHALALVSLVTVVAGFLPAYFKRPPGKWLRWHYEGICWSYLGLLGATAAEIATRLPFIESGFAFGVAAIVSSQGVIAIGAFVLYRYRDRVLAAFQPLAVGPNIQALQPTGAAALFPEASSPTSGPGG